MEYYQIFTVSAEKKTLLLDSYHQPASTHRRRQNDCVHLYNQNEPKRGLGKLDKELNTFTQAVTMKQSYWKWKHHSRVDYFSSKPTLTEKLIRVCVICCQYLKTAHWYLEVYVYYAIRRCFQLSGYSNEVSPWLTGGKIGTATQKINTSECSDP